MDLTDWLIENGGDVQAMLFFGGFALFAIAERLFPKRAPGPFRRLRWFSNLSLTALVIAVTLLMPLSMIAAALWAERAAFGLLHLADWPLLAVISATLLVRAFISFFTHFLNHKVPLLWRIHRVHHLDTDLDISTVTRFHPLEMVIGAALGLPIVALFGLDPATLVVYEFLDVTVTQFSHANLRLPAWANVPLRYLIVTPDLHLVHHSSYQPETDSNFGAVFPIWDMVFGTFRTRTVEPQETMELGLSEWRDARANSLWRLIIAPFWLGRG